MIPVLLDAILSLELFIFAILVHEIGHMVAFRYYGIKPKLQFKRAGNGFKFIFNTPEAYQSLDEAQRCIIYISGIGFGLLSLLASQEFFKIPLIFSMFWAAVYGLGCVPDLRNFVKCWKRID